MLDFLNNSFIFNYLGIRIYKMQTFIDNEGNSYIIKFKVPRQYKFKHVVKTQENIAFKNWIKSITEGVEEGSKLGVPYYNSHGDIVSLTWKNTISSSHYLNKYLDLSIDLETNEVVGLDIWNVNKLIEEGRVEDGMVRG